MIALNVMTDGRDDYLRHAVASGFSMLKGPITEFWMHDDSGDETHRDYLRTEYPTFTHIGSGPRRGFGGAYNHVWATLKSQSRAKYIFNLEDDFIFNREIPLLDIIQKLEEHPHLYQLALRRQAWSSEEIQAGGIIERWPTQFHQQDGWILHKLFFTTNPSLYRKSLVDERDYPVVKDAEGHFFLGIVNSDPDAQFGYWGEKTDAPWVNHIGSHRQPGGWY